MIMMIIMIIMRRRRRRKLFGCFLSHGFRKRPFWDPESILDPIRSLPQHSTAQQPVKLRKMEIWWIANIRGMWRTRIFPEWSLKTLVSIGLWLTQSQYVILPMANRLEKGKLIESDNEALICIFKKNTRTLLKPTTYTHTFQKQNISGGFQAKNIG